MKMNSTLSNFLIFTTGAAIGSVVAWKVTKTKYEEMKRRDADEFRAYYDEKYSSRPKTDNVEEELEEPDERNEYYNLVNELGYDNSSNDKIYEEEDDVDMVKPYVIPPEEYDENGYETMSLTYYADGVLVDETGEIVEDLDETVGADFASHFGEYEMDSVFVRNDEMKVDFEILSDEGNYPGNN